MTDPIPYLYPRPQGQDTTETETKEKQRAHQILDRAKQGECYSSAVIDWALRRTGDLT